MAARRGGRRRRRRWTTPTSSKCATAPGDPLLSQYHIVFYYIYIISYHIIVGEHPQLKQVLLTAPGDPSHDQVACDSFRQATSQRDRLDSAHTSTRAPRGRRGRRDKGAESQQARPSEPPAARDAYQAVAAKQPWRFLGSQSAMVLCPPAINQGVDLGPPTQIHGRLGVPPAHNA
jgi:hypothetical protein